MAFKIEVDPGSLSACSLALVGARGTGVNLATDSVEVCIAGSRMVRVRATEVEVIAAAFHGPVGTSAAPGMAFRGHTDTGLYISGSSPKTVGLAVGGSARWTVNANGVMQMVNNTYYAGSAKGLTPGASMSAGEVDTAADSVHIYDASNQLTRAITVAQLLSLV